MTDEQRSPSGASSPASAPPGFLGGGPKFNQAGYNAPLPGENVAEVTPQPRSKVRILIGVVLTLVLIGLLYALYVHQPGQHPTNGRGGVSIEDKPSDNPDEPGSGQ